MIMTCAVLAARLEAAGTDVHRVVGYARALSADVLVVVPDCYHVDSDPGASGHGGGRFPRDFAFRGPHSAADRPAARAGGTETTDGRRGVMLVTHAMVVAEREVIVR